MQLSLEKLFDLIEQRFGRRAATVVLALVTLAIVSLSLSAVFISVVSPVTRWLQQMAQQGTIPASLAGVMTQVLYAILLGLAMWLGTSVSMRVPTAKITKASATLDEMHLAAKRIGESFDQIEKSILPRLRELEERMNQFEGKDLSRKSEVSVRPDE